MDTTIRLPINEAVAMLIHEAVVYGLIDTDGALLKSGKVVWEVILKSLNCLLYSPSMLQRLQNKNIAMALLLRWFRSAFSAKSCLIFFRALARCDLDVPSLI